MVTNWNPIPTNFSTGVRRYYRGLGGIGGADYNSATNYVYTRNDAAAQDVANGMKSAGYDSRILDMLVGQGATAEDLQNLWDNYSPVPPIQGGNPDDYFGPPAVALIQQIAAMRAPGAGPILNAAGSAASAVQNVPAAVSNAAVAAGTAVSNAATATTSWLKQNEGWVLFGVGALILGPPLLGWLFGRR